MLGKMLEKEIEKKVTDYATKKGFLVYKFTSPNNRGVPDRILITPTGVIFFIEFKRKGKVPTTLQAHIFKKLTDMNCKVYVVDEPEKGYKIIDGYN